MMMPPMASLTLTRLDDLGDSVHVGELSVLQFGVELTQGDADHLIPPAIAEGEDIAITLMGYGRELMDPDWSVTVGGLLDGL